MNKIIYQQIGTTYNCYINKKYIGELSMVEDGYYYYFLPNDFNNGYIPAWVMKALAHKLEDLNHNWDTELKEALQNTGKSDEHSSI